MRALSVLTAYTEREYVGLECLWLEAMSALLLVIGMLNSCCEAKKLSESCAGIIGSIVLASLGVAAAVVIRLPEQDFSLAAKGSQVAQEDDDELKRTALTEAGSSLPITPETVAACEACVIMYLPVYAFNVTHR